MDTLNKECTVYQAELEAIRRAAKVLNENGKNWKIKYVKIFSDSMSSLQALDSIKKTSKTVRDAAIELNKLATVTKRLTLCWIKAHVGHQGNEIADKLAKRALSLIHI